jgi:glycosyltransferase involved in cell wall biosynthesis
MKTRLLQSCRPLPRASIIIPAYNEGQVIGRCLELLLKDAEPGEFDIVVVCNGCIDDTEKVARSPGASVRVFTIDQASKTAALNYGDRVARVFPRVYLDADLEVTTGSIRSLIAALDNNTPAAIGFMDVDTDERSWLVRSFYHLWVLHPYLQRGKFGGIYALSQQGCQLRGAYPDLLGDDAFVRNAFEPGEFVAVNACRFRVFPPYTVRDIFRIRSRIYLGNYQLRAFSHEVDHGPRSGTREWLRRVVDHPETWLGLPIYIALNLAAKINALRLYRQSNYQWLRDNSSRAGASG